MAPITWGRVLFPNAGDCDDKAVACVSWALLKGIKVRIVTASSRPDQKLHHVFTDMMVGNQWMPFDPTYNWCVFGVDMNHYTKRIVQWQS
jgi:transglutaminase-like putative cysteine protease